MGEVSSVLKHRTKMYGSRVIKLHIFLNLVLSGGNLLASWYRAFILRYITPGNNHLLFNKCHWFTVLRETRPSKTYLKVSCIHTIRLLTFFKSSCAL
jgi:hypothetical protein